MCNRRGNVVWRGRRCEKWSSRVFALAREVTVGVCANADDMLTEEQNELVESAAEMLYGLIHVRYILTSKGMTAMVCEVWVGRSGVWMGWRGGCDVFARVVCSRCMSGSNGVAVNSWRSARMWTSVDVRACTAPDSHACRWASRMFPERAP